jgi:hypothetical protein
VLPVNAPALVGIGVEGLTNVFHFNVARVVAVVMLMMPGSVPVKLAVPVYSSPRLPTMCPISCIAVVAPEPIVIASVFPRRQPPPLVVFRMMNA